MLGTRHLYIFCYHSGTLNSSFRLAPTNVRSARSELVESFFEISNPSSRNLPAICATAARLLRPSTRVFDFAFAHVRHRSAKYSGGVLRSYAGIREVFRNRRSAINKNSSSLPSHQMRKIASGE